jgi:peptidoglycan hydrolase-like protein with peptidoglycan-binding domain
MAKRNKKSAMSTATLSQPILTAGTALLGSAVKAGQWAIARYMRAPLASTGILAMVTMTALAGSNALYFQTADHPSPFFATARDQVAALPTPSNARPESVLPPIAEPQAAPAVADETTGSVAVQAVVPDAPVGNAQMFAVQKRLFELNLFSGTIDGYYGPKTAEAIRAFETRNGLTPTGAMNQAVMDAIMGADTAGRTVQPVAPQPVVQPQAVIAPVVPVAQQQDQLVRRLPELSPAEQAFDNVAQTAANTIDSILSTVDTSRGSAPAVANPPTPSASLPTQPVQAMPQPVMAAAVSVPAPTAAAVNTAPRTPPANDTELVRQIQTGLASLGFFQTQVDGKPGPETARAIREFESFYRYRMTGQVQPDLVDLLLKAGATI